LNGDYFGHIVYADLSFIRRAVPTEELVGLIKSGWHAAIFYNLALFSTTFNSGFAFISIKQNKNPLLRKQLLVQGKTYT
jgi:hypothetical protein